MPTPLKKTTTVKQGLIFQNLFSKKDDDGKLTNRLSNCHVHIKTKLMSSKLRKHTLGFPSLATSIRSCPSLPCLMACSISENCSGFLSLPCSSWCMGINIGSSNSFTSAKKTMCYDTSIQDLPKQVKDLRQTNQCKSLFAIYNRPVQTMNNHSCMQNQKSVQHKSLRIKTWIQEPTIFFFTNQEIL